MGLNLLMVAGSAIAAALRFIGGILYRPDEEGERTSIWSVRRRDAQLFFTMTFAFWAIAASSLACVQYQPDAPELLWQIAPPLADGETPTVYTLVERFGKTVVGLAAAAMFLTPILITTGRCLMAIAKFINEKLLVPRVNKIVEPHLNRKLAEIDEAAAESRAESLAEAIAEAIAEIRAETVAETRAETAAEIRAEAIAEIRAEAAAEIRAEVNSLWRRWLERRNAALARGENFDEPPPDLTGQPNS